MVKKLELIDYTEGIPGVVDESAALEALVPQDLSQMIAEDYGVEDRERLAKAAAEAAYDEVSQAYRTPFIKFAAQRAVRLALGLESLPQEEQGDN